MGIRILRPWYFVAALEPCAEVVFGPRAARPTW